LSLGFLRVDIGVCRDDTALETADTKTKTAAKLAAKAESQSFWQTQKGEIKMATEIIASKEPEFASEVGQSTRGYGQNGYAGASSLTPSQARKVSKTYASLASDSMNITANASNVQMRKISASAIKASPTMKNPNSSPAKIPNKLSFGAPVPPSVKPAKPGNAKR
jgi:hypothetical protein